MSQVPAWKRSFPGRAGAYVGAAAGEGGSNSAAGNADSRTAVVDDFGHERRAAAAEGFVPAVDASRGSAVEARDGAVAVEGAAATGSGDVGGTASVGARRGALVNQDCRAVAIAVKIESCPTSDGITSEDKQCRGRAKPLSYIYDYEKKHVAVCGAAVDEERGGVGDVKPAALEANMAVDDGEALVSEPADATLPNQSSQALPAGGSVDAVVVLKLAQIYKELRMKMLDVEREKAAAGHAGAGHRA